MLFNQWNSVVPQKYFLLSEVACQHEIHFFHASLTFVKLSNYKQKGLASDKQSKDLKGNQCKLGHSNDVTGFTKPLSGDTIESTH